VYQYQDAISFAPEEVNDLTDGYDCEYANCEWEPLTRLASFKLVTVQFLALSILN